MQKIKKAFCQIFFFPGDVKNAYKNDPALHGKFLGFLELVLYPGVWAIFFHRISHTLFCLYIPFIPRLISQAARFLTGIEIHPGAYIGKGFFIDHGMGVVIGETAEIGENVLMYHQVTLGGTTLQAVKRHPTVGNNVLIGAGAKIFGPIFIGDNSQIGGSAVVTSDVPSFSVVVGNPGRVVKLHGKKIPTECVDQIHLPDPIMKSLGSINKRLNEIEKEIAKKK